MSGIIAFKMSLGILIHPVTLGGTYTLYNIPQTETNKSSKDSFDNK